MQLPAIDRVLYLVAIIVLFAIVCFTEVDLVRAIIGIVLLQGASSLLCLDAGWVSWAVMCSFISCVLVTLYFLHWWQSTEIDIEAE